MTAQEAVEECAVLCDRLADGYLDEGLAAAARIDYGKALSALAKTDAFRSAARLIREQIGEKLR